MTDLPYQAEYAKSGRASCKGCKQKIDNGALRLAAMVQSAFFDGKQPNWYHEECFFEKQRPKTVDDIGRFNVLKNTDQQRLQEKISSLSDIVLPVQKGKGKGKGKGTKRGNADSNASSALKDFAIEYSKSSRATCRVCEIKIAKDEVRISKTVFDTEVGQKYGGQALWHHVKCFVEARAELLYLAGGEDLPGFKNLSKDDQKMVKAEIKPMTGDDVPVKKMKAEPLDEVDAALNNNIEKQNKVFHKHKDSLDKLTTRELQDILSTNSQYSSSNKNECALYVADIMAFGALEPCPECVKGQLVLENFGYKCTGDITEWTKCQYVTQNPKRVPMVIPEEVSDKGPFKKFKPKVAVRLFKSAPKPQIVVVKKEESNGVKKERPIPPLKNLQFFIYGSVKNKDEIKKRIIKLGGLVPSKLTDTVAAVISTLKDVESNKPKMGEIQEKEIEVVEVTYLDLIDAECGTIANSLQLIQDNNIAEWGSDPRKRVPQDIIDGKSIPKSGSMYVKSGKSGPTKLKVKDGFAVDPDSGLEDIAHVYKDKSGKHFSVVLGQTDIVAQKNSFYKLQLLEADSYKRYWVFRSWGRIGTTVGGNKVEEVSNLYKAIDKFSDLFTEKTENDWLSSKFQKVPGRYHVVEVDYGGDDQSQSVVLKEDVDCKLPMPLQKLIMHIFDIEVMKRTLLEYELDTDKMPLGKLSKKQIKTGYSVLSELITYLEKGEISQSKIIDATNRFYTLVPHSFGMENPPLLDNMELIKTKTLMLDNLLEIEIAYSMLKTESSELDSPIEAHYKKLKSEIVPLDKTTPEYEMLLKYVENTHASTHSSYTLEVQQIFKVVREGEDKRYKPFKKLHNRRLLWHGSRTTNFAGILSQGLRIAPPEAPVTGYMFGKGIYFADMVSKSANYCCTNKHNPIGVMMLCEVALGNMKECTSSEFVTKLPPNLHSVWGQGRTQPNPKENHILENGTILPLGKAEQRQINTSLLYNEFIVYDVAQVNVKYLFQMKFNWNY